MEDSKQAIREAVHRHIFAGPLDDPARAVALEEAVYGWLERMEAVARADEKRGYRGLVKEQEYVIEGFKRDNDAQADRIEHLEIVVKDMYGYLLGEREGIGEAVLRTFAEDMRELELTDEMEDAG